MVTADKVVVELQARVDKYMRDTRKAQMDFSQRMGRIEQSAKRGEAALSRVGSGAATFFRSFAVGAAAALGPMQLFNRTMQAITSTSALAKVADKVGIGAEALQRLRFGFELAGVAANQTDVALQRFSRRVGEAANGAGELEPILKANNIQLRNQDGTMRSQVDILREYAGLIKNAGSEQERLLLAFKAFDTEGAGLVNALRDGAAGLDKLMGKADEAGGVIEEELVRKAEDLDDRFAALWRRFDVNSKSAILGAADALDGLGDKLGELGNSPFWQRLAEFAGAGDAVFVPGEGVFNPGSDEMTPSSRVAQAFQGTVGEQISAADAELINELQKRYQSAASQASQTIVPGKGGGGGGSRGGGRARANAFERESDRIMERIEAIKAETEAQAGLNPLVDDYGLALERAAATQELLSAAKRAGLEITPELEAQIDDLAMAYASASVEANKLSDSQRRAVQQATELQSLGRDVLGGFIDDLRNGTSAADALQNALGRIADKLLEIALSSLFSGGLGRGGLFGGAIIPGILHEGGVAGRDGYGHGRAVSPSAFAGARRYHSGGVAGLMPGEVPAILQRGEMVLPRGSSGSQPAGAPRSVVEVILSPDLEGRVLTQAAQQSVVIVDQKTPGIVNASVGTVQQNMRNRPGWAR